MPYKARRIGSETGPNPSVEYFAFNGRLFNPGRVAAFLVDNGFALNGRVYSLSDGFSKGHTFVTIGAQRPSNRTTPPSTKSFRAELSTDRMCLEIYEDHGMGYIEIQAMGDFASAPEYRSIVERLGSSATHIRLNRKTSLAVRTLEHAVGEMERGAKQFATAMKDAAYRGWFNGKSSLEWHARNLDAFAGSDTSFDLGA